MSILNLFSKKKIFIPSLLKDFYKVFEHKGFKAYLVGGAVRDIFLKKEASDWDVATNATPQDVIKLFKTVIPTGIEHGTVTVHFKGTEIEVTTFRTETGYSDGRHPDSVNYATTIEEDLSRRDFTMNAIAVDLKDGKIVDPFGGQKDIRKKVIRTVGNAHERFMEDGLRPIRAIRFASKLGFSIKKSTYSQLFEGKIKEKIASISVERFRDELMKIMSSPKPSIALKMMEETGIMQIFMSEVMPCRSCIQKDDRGFHIFDVMDHNIYACDGAPIEKPLLRFAAFLHDSGKPKSKTERTVEFNTKNGEQSSHKINNFYNHERYSVEIAKSLMTKLKFSNAEIFYVTHLIENHMFHYESTWSDAAIRRFLVKIQPEYLDDLIDLRLADMYGKYNAPVRIHDSAACQLLIELKERVEKLQSESQALSLKDLAINGNDLIALGVPAGKKIGLILDELFNAVLEDPGMNEREKLLIITKNMI